MKRGMRNAERGVERASARISMEKDDPRRQIDWSDLRRGAPRIELPDPMQIAAYRRMSPAERIAAGFATTQLVREVLRGRFRATQPEATDAEINRLIAERLLGDAG